MSTPSVPSLAGTSLFSGQPSTDVGAAAAPLQNLPLEASSQPRPVEGGIAKTTSSSDVDDLYAVPESDTADFVGIGSLGHIIRKCFKEIYYPGQGEDGNPGAAGSKNSLTSGDSATSVGDNSVEFKELSGEELEALDEEARRAYNEAKLAHDAQLAEQESGKSSAGTEAEAAPEDSQDGSAGNQDVSGAPEESASVNPEVPNTTRSTDIESARADGSAVVQGDGADGENPGEPGPQTIQIPVPADPPILPLPIAFEAEEEGAKEKDRIDQQLRERVAQAKELLLHLDAKREEALKADEEDRVNMLEEHGLLLKVEIPRGPSHLDLDASTLSTRWPEFGSDLILASELFRQIDRANAARLGNNMSPEAMERAMKSADVPHYMEMTGTVKVRRKINEGIREKRPKQRAAYKAKRKRLLEITEKR